VNEPYADRPSRDFVVAVGSGPTLDAARGDAMRGIAAFLGVEIRASVAVDERETAGTAGGSSARSVEAKVNSIIGARLSSVVLEKAHSEGATTYVLAVLEKRPFLLGLQHEADNLARSLEEGVRAEADRSAHAPPSLQNLALIAASLQLLESRILALGGEVPEPQARTLRDGLGFLARLEVRVDVNVTPAAPPAAERPLFDPEDPRLQKAIRETGALLGHPIEFHFDVAQMPKERAFFEGLFERFIGRIPKDVEAVQRRSPRIVAHGGPALRHLDLGFDGSKDEPEIAFDRASGRLRLTMTSRRPEMLVPSNVVSYALEKDWEAHLVEKFGGREAADVAAADRADYFDFLTGSSPYRTRAPRPASREERLAQSPEAVTVLRVVALAKLLRDDAPLAARAQKWLLGRHELFGQAYVHDAEVVARLGPDTAFRRAEATWVAWLEAGWSALPQATRVELFKDMIGRSVSPGARGGRWNPAAFPGWRWDRAALALLDEWVAAGREAGARGRRDGARRDGIEQLLEPVSYGSQGMRSAGARDWSSLHAVLLRTPESRQAYLDALLRHRDPRLLETAIVNLLGAEAPEDLFFVWRGLEKDEELWRTATRVIGEQEAVTASCPVYDEAVRLWRAYPKRRGAILYLLAAYPFTLPDARVWTGFAGTFGGAITKAELADYLGQGFRAVKNLGAMWPALAGDFSRVELLLPHLDAWFDEPLVRKTDFQDPQKSLQAIVHLLRAEKRSGELAALHGWLRRRVEGKPSEGPALSTLLELTKGG
jgi:hypothetical protein